MKVPLLDLAAQYTALGEQIEAAVVGVLRSGRYILGPQVAALEQEVCRFTGVPHAVGCASGSDALLLALMALGVGPGDEVITSPFTFFATAGSIHRLGARPVFADIEAASFNLDPGQVARRITSRTRAIVPAHLYGRLARVDAIREAAGGRIPVVEDAAQALGARLGPRAAGALGVAGCFSFYPTKNLGGAGDAGLVVTHDPNLAERLRRLRSHGASDGYHHDPYHHDEVGLNSRLDEVQAAILRVKLSRLEEWNHARRQQAAEYTRLLAGLVRTPEPDPDGAHIYHQYVIRVEGRDSLRRLLGEHGVETAVYYPLPLHLQKCFAYLGHGPGDFPQAESAAREVLALPIYPELSAAAREHVAGVIARFVAQGRVLDEASVR